MFRACQMTEAVLLLKPFVFNQRRGDGKCPACVSIIVFVVTYFVKFGHLPSQGKTQFKSVWGQDAEEDIST
jgi:hypothetical protein